MTVRVMQIAHHSRKPQDIRRANKKNWFPSSSIVGQRTRRPNSLFPTARRFLAKTTDATLLGTAWYRPQTGEYKGCRSYAASMSIHSLTKITGAFILSASPLPVSIIAMSIIMPNEPFSIAGDLIQNFNRVQLVDCNGSLLLCSGQEGGTFPVHGSPASLLLQLKEMQMKNYCLRAA